MSFEVDEALQTDGLIRTALEALSYRHTPEATELLQSLLDDGELAEWREPIAEAFDAQRVARLDAEFEPPTILDVASVLKDGHPANAADLAALAVENTGRRTRPRSNPPASRHSSTSCVINFRRGCKWSPR